MSGGHLVFEPMARWSNRLGLFALALSLVCFTLHRVGQLSTPVALNVGLLALALAAVAVACGLWAIGSIWIRGRAGAGAAAIGLIAAALPWAPPLAALPTILALPRINDVSTDTANPPTFNILSKVRGPGANSATYGGARVAQLQSSAYADLRTFVVERPIEEVFDLAVLSVRGRRGLGWRVLTEEPPSAGKPGVIEATERTMIAGFVDDIVIRVAGRDGEARVDIRSASRFGAHDLGANASRIRRFLRELQGRLEATTPGSPRARIARPGVDLPGVRRPLDRSPATKGAKGGANPAPRDARRAPAQRVPPRG